MRPWLNKISLEGFGDAEADDWPRYAAQLVRDLPALIGADPDLKSIVEDFENLLESPDGACAYDFDEVLTSLYNWGDYGKRLWIGTP